jgi:hypothetical protein
MARAIRLLAAFATLAGMMLAQTAGQTAARGISIRSAMDEAGRALKHYQSALASLGDLPEFDTAVRRDSQVLLSSRNTFDWLRGKFELEGAVVPSEFVGLLESIDGCASNAALSASALAADAATSGSERRLRTAMDLVSISEQLWNSADHIRRALKPYLRLERPPQHV